MLERVGKRAKMEIMSGILRLTAFKLWKAIKDAPSSILRFFNWVYTPDDGEKARWDNANSPRAAMVTRFMRVIF